MATQGPQTLERLAVIESRLNDISRDLRQISELIPSTLVEHSQRIAVVERTQRSLAWGISLGAGGLLTAFVAHVFG